MPIDTPIVNCGECDLQLDEDTNVPTETRLPCPACGSVTRSIHVTIHEIVAIKEKLGMKGRHAGGGKPYIEQVQGDDLHRDTWTWRRLRRTIDRENNMYHEVVIDSATGEVLHECREPLSEHRDHGAAKKTTRETEWRKNQL